MSTDAGGRGMRRLVVPGDLLASAEIFARLRPGRAGAKPRVIILTGFPCCVDRDPPTETDGLASVAIAGAALGLGYEATVVTEECNAPVFRAAVDGVEEHSSINLAFFPAKGGSGEGSGWTCDHDEELKRLAGGADLVIACERAGPAADGMCYTMRGINMNERGLIAPLHDIVTHVRGDDDGSTDDVKFIAIGDGGNELGMGKVIDQIREHIPDGKRIGAVMAADHLVAASVSNWGGYALVAAAALVRGHDDEDADECGDDVAAGDKGSSDNGEARRRTRRYWVDRCVPTEQAETQLLHRCVAAGCRDGVSGRMEATVDGMPLERSMECLREIRKVALGGE